MEAIEKIEQTQLQMQKDVHDMQRDVSEMKDFLLGNQFNNKQGLQSILDDHDSRLVNLEEHKQTIKVYSDLMKWFFGMMITSIIGLIIFFLQESHKK